MTRFAKVTVVALTIATIAASLPPAATAHPLAPALLDLRAASDGTVAVSWKTSRRRMSPTEVEPMLPPRCRTLDPATTEVEQTAVISRWRVDCGADGLVGKTIAVTGLAEAATDVLVRVVTADGRVLRQVLSGSRPKFVVPEREGRWSIVGGYVAIGNKHILGGLDHLLFVFGLLLLVRNPRALVATITAFTIGHSVTLSLAVLGIARVPSAPIEVLIALSVVVLAVEIAAGGDGALGRRPWAMASCFGLLHGLGFASALREVGLPPGEIPLALLSFNLGIELGQLSFVLVILALRRLFGAVVSSAPPWSVQVPVYVMGSLAAMWVIERSVALLY